MPPKPKPLAERFWPKVKKTEGCWLWTGVKNGGYGIITYGSPWTTYQIFKAHRVSYILAHGEPPPGTVLHHVCENRGCVNPDHLKPVTRAEHVLHHPDMHEARQSHCKRGHPFDAENTIWGKGRGNDLYRSCRICCKVRRRQRYERDRLASSLAP